MLAKVKVAFMYKTDGILRMLITSKARSRVAHAPVLWLPHLRPLKLDRV